MIPAIEPIPNVIQPGNCDPGVMLPCASCLRVEYDENRTAELAPWRSICRSASDPPLKMDEETHNRPDAAVQSRPSLLGDNLLDRVRHAVESRLSALRVLDHLGPSCQREGGNDPLDSLRGGDGDNGLHHTGSETGEHRSRGSEFSLLSASVLEQLRDTSSRRRPRLLHPHAPLHP